MSETQSLRSVATIITKGTTPTTIGGQFTKEGINFVKSESICGSKYLDSSLFMKIDEYTDQKLRRSRLKKNDLLFSIAGAYLGKIAIVRECDLPANTNQAVGIVRLDESLANVDYVYYYFSQSHVNEYINNLSAQSSQPNLNLDMLGNLNFNCPKLSIQRKISEVLSFIDKKIELNNQINTQLEKMAKMLYDYWFVQFDFPDENGKPYKSSGGRMVYNDILKRKIPYGWDIDKMCNVISVKDGTHDSPKSQLTGYPLITSKHLLEDGIDFGSANLISEKDYIEINKRSNVETGDILFSMIGTVGTLYKIEEVNVNFAIKNVALYKTSSKIEYKNYIYMYLKSHDAKSYMSNVLSGSIQKFIGLGSLRSMPLIISEKYIQNFEQQTSELFEQINNLKKQNRMLSKLRDWLLPMLMNGQVKVK